MSRVLWCFLVVVTQLYVLWAEPDSVSDTKNDTSSLNSTSYSSNSENSTEISNQNDTLQITQEDSQSKLNEEKKTKELNDNKDGKNVKNVEAETGKVSEKNLKASNKNNSEKNVKAVDGSDSEKSSEAIDGKDKGTPVKTVDDSEKSEKTEKAKSSTESQNDKTEFNKNENGVLNQKGKKLSKLKADKTKTEKVMNIDEENGENDKLPKTEKEDRLSTLAAAKAAENAISKIAKALSKEEEKTIDTIDITAPLKTNAKIVNDSRTKNPIKSNAKISNKKKHHQWKSEKERNHWEGSADTEEHTYSSTYVDNDYPESDRSYNHNDKDYYGEEESNYEPNYNTQPQQEQGYHDSFNNQPEKWNTPSLESQLYEYKDFPPSELNQNHISQENPFQNVANEGNNLMATNFDGNNQQRIGQSIADIGQGSIGQSIIGPVQGRFNTILQHAPIIPSQKLRLNGRLPVGINEELHQASYQSNIAPSTLGPTGLTQDEYRQLEDGVQPAFNSINNIQQEDLGTLSYARKRTHKANKSKKQIFKKKQIKRKHIKIRSAARKKLSFIERPYKRTIMLGNRICGSKKYINFHVKRNEIAYKHGKRGSIPSRNHGTDICCNEHNECPRVVPAKSNKYGYQNDIEYDVMACSCDAKFRRCLKNANSNTADAVGHLYFNTLKIPCLTFEQELHTDISEQPKSDDVSDVVSVVPDAESEREMVGGAQLVVSPKSGFHPGKQPVKEAINELWNNLKKEPNGQQKINDKIGFNIDQFIQQQSNSPVDADNDNKVRDRLIKEKEKVDQHQDFYKKEANKKIGSQQTQFQKDYEKSHYQTESDQKEFEQPRFQKQVEQHRFQKDAEQIHVQNDLEESMYRKQLEQARIQKEADQVRVQKDTDPARLQKEDEQSLFQKQIEQKEADQAGNIQKENEYSRSQKELFEQSHTQKDIEPVLKETLQVEYKEPKQNRFQKEKEQNNKYPNIEEQQILTEAEAFEAFKRKGKRPNIMNPNPSPHNPNPYTGKLRGIVTTPEAYIPRLNTSH